MTKKARINEKLKQLGKPLGINEIDAIQAKRTIKNIVALAFVAVIFAFLGRMLMPGGFAGYYYSGGGIKDFNFLLR